MRSEKHKTRRHWCVVCDEYGLVAEDKVFRMHAMTPSNHHVFWFPRFPSLPPVLPVGGFPCGSSLAPLLPVGAVHLLHHRSPPATAIFSISGKFLVGPVPSFPASHNQRYIRSPYVNRRFVREMRSEKHKTRRRWGVVCNECGVVAED